MTRPFQPPMIPTNPDIPQHDSPAALIAKINAEASGVWASFGVDSFERGFLVNNVNKQSFSISQWAMLGRIWDKVFPDQAGEV